MAIIETMFSLNKEEQQALRDLGARLVQGDPNVKVGYWILAVNLIGSLEDFGTILQAKPSFFSVRESETNKPYKRRRVRRKR